MAESLGPSMICVVVRVNMFIEMKIVCTLYKSEGHIAYRVSSDA